MAATVAGGLKVAFTVLGCAIIAAFIYIGVAMGYSIKDFFATLWSVAFMIDIIINFLPFWMWIFYKELNWIHSVMWIILVSVFGSAALFPYIVLQLLKLSPQESAQDPIYFVLRSNTMRDERESKSILSVISARVLFGGLGCFMLGMVIYVTATEGSPFHREIFTPGTLAVFLDDHNVLIALSIWVAYKEPTWLTAAFWIISLLCFHSIGTCVYIARQLSQLSPGDPISLVLFSSNSRTGNGYEEIY